LIAGETRNVQKNAVAPLPPKASSDARAARESSDVYCKRSDSGGGGNPPLGAYAETALARIWKPAAHPASRGEEAFDFIPWFFRGAGMGIDSFFAYLYSTDTNLLIRGYL
jgi:hypothetical protein